MIDLIKKYFGKSVEASAGEKPVADTHDIRIATCALFLEMANIDGEFSDSEKEQIIDLLKREYHLSEENVAQLLEASHAELKDSIDLWKFTNQINQNFSLEEKIRIIEMIWKLAYVDGILDKHEDYLLHKLGNLLRLSHKQLIEAKIKVLHG